MTLGQLLVAKQLSPQRYNHFDPIDQIHAQNQAANGNLANRQWCKPAPVYDSQAIITRSARKK
jgi:hypothetical protein